jgi:uncharacterized repeat protein (TIGR03803 family)
MGKCLLFFLLFIGLSINVNAQFKVIGMAKLGGANGFGTIFSATPSNGNAIVTYSFTGNAGFTPTNSTTILAGGMLYGTTQSGGTNNLGVLYKLDPTTNTYTIMHHFTKATGANPLSALMVASSGKLYGTTRFGGTNDFGVIFEYDLSNSVYTKKADFASSTGYSTSGALCQAANGLLYGVNNIGALGTFGTLFEFNPTTNALAVKYIFNSANTINGRFPNGGLTAIGNRLWGAASAGGANSAGTIFTYTISNNSFAKRFDFTTATSGSGPVGQYVFHNGKIYGTASYGGANSDGTLFEFDTTTNTFLKLLDFSNTTSGRLPSAGLMMAANNKMYGITRQGGTSDLGVVYELNPVGNLFTVKAQITTAIGSNSIVPFTQYNNKLIANTNLGGVAAGGTIFSYDTTTFALAKLIDFGKSEAANPHSGFIITSTGRYIGTTAEGGTTNNGTLIEYLPATNTITVLHNFLGGSAGATPKGNVLEAPNGKLYGVTTEGGANGLGVIFEFTPSTNVTLIRKDLGGGVGDGPLADLIYSTGTKLIGMGYQNGLVSNGTVFEYDYSANTVTLKYNMPFATGDNPSGTPIRLNTGIMYGATTSGGANFGGVVYEYNTSTNVYTKRYDFDITQGYISTAALMLASNGKFYGTTEAGGANGFGIIFEYVAGATSITKLYDFTNANGKASRGKMVEGSNGKLYGLTREGGASGLGVLYEFDIATNCFVKVFDLNGTTGFNPEFCKLLPVSITCTLPIFDSVISNYNNVCSGKQVILSVSASSVLNGAGNWRWYTGACGGCNATAIGTGSTITVTPTANTTYYARAEGGCTIASLCKSKAITVSPITINSATPTHLICNGQSTGSTAIMASGGTGIYTISPTPSSLAAGTYIFTVLDATSCSNSTSITITEASAIMPTVSTINHVLCNGQNNGSVSFTPTGGTAGYTITPTQNSLLAASYIFTVTDALGCTKTTQITITQPSLISSSANITHATCNTFNNGAYTVTANGGSGPYTYSPSNIQAGLAANNYTVNITDASNCTVSAVITITEPAAIGLNATANNTVLNVGDVLILNATSNNGVSYSWAGPNAANSSTATLQIVPIALSNAGIYTATATAANGCVQQSTITITVINPVYLSAKVILSGCYMPASNLMTNHLASNNILPSTEPYTTSLPYSNWYTAINTSGGENTTNTVLSTIGNDAIVDWVFLQLHNPSNPTQIVATRSALLQRDGDVVDVDGVSPVEFLGLTNNNYFVSIRHRNHLGVMTASPITFTNNPTIVDFTNLATGLYVQPIAGLQNNTPLTGPTRVIAGKRALYAGNCNIVSNPFYFITYNASIQSDRWLLLNTVGPTGVINGYSEFDCDLNGFAKFNGLNPDRLIILNNCNNSNTIVVQEQIPR